MTSFFAYETKLGERQPATGNVLTTAWSQCDQSILAVSTKNGDVSFFHEEGEPLEIEEGREVKREAECHHLAWHPRQTILALGWDDGTVQLWSETRGQSDSVVHKAPITHMCWSPDSSRLITGDQSGMLAVWEGRLGNARLILVCRYSRKGAITNVVFRGPSAMMYNEGIETSAACPPFFFGGGSGVVDFGDDTGHCTEAFNVGAPLNSLFYSHSGDYLIVVTVDVVLFKYDIKPDSRLTLDKKVKLSIKGDGSDLSCVWAGGGLLAASNNEGCLRMWHLSRDENYMLKINDPKHMAENNDKIISVSFNPRRRLLAGGTSNGKVLMWKFVGEYGGAKPPSEDDWDVMSPIDVASSVSRLHWGPGEGLLSVGMLNDATILAQTVLHCKTVDSNSAIQMSSDTLFLQSSEGRHKKVTTQVRIKGLDITDDYAVVWNGKQAEVRNMSDSMFSAVTTFNTKAKCIVIKGETLYLGVSHWLEIASIRGVKKSSIGFTDQEGSPTHLDINKNFLALATDKGVLKLFNVSRTKPQPVVPGRDFKRECPGTIKSIRVNNNGTKISMVFNKIIGAGVHEPDTNLYVYDVELDKVFTHEFGPNFYPINHCWDPSEPRLIAVESKKLEMSATKAHEAKQRDLSEYEVDTVEVKRTEAEVTTLFATSDYGVLMQDSFPIAAVGESIMGIDVPYIFFMSRPVDDDDSDDDGNISKGPLPRVKMRTMRDFVGLEKVNDDTKKDLINFSYYLTVGNMDEAYRAVKKISSETIWENMAQMCVKTKRLDVAEVCLGNMNNARGARAVRMAKKEPEKDAQVAMVAIQLGLLEDAENLYTGCGRFDLLCKLYMACGRWRDALAVCAKHDRINLRTTHYQYAKYLEVMGETAEAIKNYEKSGTHRTEVPRMLYDANHLPDLERYIKASEDNALIKWWAQYCESNEATEEAIKYYSQAKEVESLVRVHCFRDEDNIASKICMETGDKAACYHLARHFESQDQIKQAIQFYTKAKKFNHGVRLAKEHGMDNELMTLSLEGNKKLKVQAATYFEEKEVYDKAVLLYQRGGKTPKALELCFRARLFDALRSISDDLDTDTDPALLSRCADFFLDNNQYDKAVHLFITAKQHEKALKLCLEYDCKITDKMAELMTPPKTMPKEERQEILLRLAQCCKDQGAYNLACKKFTQAGDKIKAMESLIKSADTEKIIYYATMTKKKDIYILAANYLQNLDWHNEPDVMKTIINFYTKARAMQQLSVFYDACAQVEIDEYRDYEKALGALKESLKYMIKAKSIQNKDSKLASLDQRIQLVERFVSARKYVKRSPQEMVQICNGLLDSPDVASAIRVGDVFALLIEYYSSQQMYQDAYDMIERMRDRKITLGPYLDNKMVQTIHQNVGAPMPDEFNGGGNDHRDDEIDDDIGEEIG